MEEWKIAFAMTIKYLIEKALTLDKKCTELFSKNILLFNENFLNQTRSFDAYFYLLD